MNAKKFSDALSALDGRYVEEAARYRRKHGQSFWVRWGAAAACLCLLAAGGALLIQGRGRAAPDPQQVQIPNPILTVASAAEMEAYLDFKVPVLEKEVEAYSVFISDGYPTMGQVDYAAPSFVSSMGVETSAESTAAHWRRAERLRASASHTTNMIVCRMPSGKRTALPAAICTPMAVMLRWIC